MSGWTIGSMLAHLLRWTVAAAFIYAGLAKLGSPAELASSVARFQILPLPLINPLALGLAPLEIICGVALIVGPWKRSAGFSLVLLSAVFFVALVSAAWRGIDVECHCFGAAKAEPLGLAIGRDALLLAAAVAVYLRLCRGSALPVGTERESARRATLTFSLQ